MSVPASLEGPLLSEEDSFQEVNWVVGGRGAGLYWPQVY